MRILYAQAQTHKGVVMSRIVIVGGSGIVAIIAIMYVDTYSIKGFIMIAWMLSLGLIDYFIQQKRQNNEQQKRKKTRAKS